MDRLAGALDKILRNEDRLSVAGRIRKHFGKLEEAHASGLTYAQISAALSEEGIVISPLTLARNMQRLRQRQNRLAGQGASASLRATRSISASRATRAVDTPSTASQRTSGDAIRERLDFSSNEALHRSIDAKYFDEAAPNERLVKIIERARDNE